MGRVVIDKRSRVNDAESLPFKAENKRRETCWKVVSGEDDSDKSDVMKV